jgi:hypothetical protein
MVSMPAIRIRAQQTVLNPSIGQVMRLMARWSFSTMLSRYFDWCIFDGQAAVGLHARDRRRVGTALVYRDLVGHVVPVDGALVERAHR